MAAIGFIGVGHMGGPMAINLVKAGHQVKVFDLSEDAVKQVATQGGIPAKSIPDVLDNVAVVVTMLPAGKHVRSVYLGDQGLLSLASPNTFFIDSSTIDVETARDVINSAKEKGFSMVDAPVSGGTAGAAAGTLTFMVGGDDAHFATAKPYLDIMGKNIFHAGPAGSGQAAKICNNMMLGIQMISVAEGFKLGEQLGLNPQALFDICSTASSQCWSMTSYCPVPGPVPTSPANNDYQAGFMSNMMLKDLRLAQEVAGSIGAVTPLGKHATELYTQFCEEGHGEVDFSGIINMLKGN